MFPQSSNILKQNGREGKQNIFRCLLEEGGVISDGQFKKITGELLFCCKFILHDVGVTEILTSKMEAYASSSRMLGKFCIYSIKAILINMHANMGHKLINIISFMKRERKQSEESELDEGNRKIVKEDRLIPKKKDYRMRAHINPLNTTPFPFPAHHTFVDWKAHYPLHFGASMEENHKAYCNTVEHPSYYEQPRQYPLNGKNVEIIDVGCGYGGLLFGLAPLFLGRMILGMEIRDKLVNFVS